jgi:hypothetical protein
MVFIASIHVVDMGLDAFNSSRNHSKEKTRFKSEGVIERRNRSSLLIS